MRNPPTNMDDVIDSRDVIARIAELEDERDSWPSLAGDQDGGPMPTPSWEVENPDDAQELAALTALADGASGYAADWQYGETLVRDSYFQTYAEELAYDIGAIPKGVTWPLTCIHWEEAANELQQDYTAVDFDGIRYWVR